MQRFLFVSRSFGVSKKGNDYDFTEVSNGLKSFLLVNGEGIGEQISSLKLKKGQPFMGDVHVDVSPFGGLEGTLVEVKPIT